MKKLILGAIVLAFFAAGCAITDYPVITDDRGSYSGIIRTGHKAYIVPSMQVASLWPDGSDELFSMVYQNNYGDQKIYTFNNFDPTASVNFLTQTYCDWRYDGCVVAEAWNPANAAIDSVFDYTWDTSCLGARSLSLLVSYTSRIGECGDRWSSFQDKAAEFANLATTTWRGGTAYVLPVNAETTSVSLNGVQAPIYGQFTIFMTSRDQLLVPMTPNARHELAWLNNFVAENGNQANLTLTYGSVSANLDIGLVPAGLIDNLNRF